MCVGYWRGCRPLIGARRPLLTTVVTVAPQKNINQKLPKKAAGEALLGLELLLFILTNLTRKSNAVCGISEADAMRRFRWHSVKCFYLLVVVVLRTHAKVIGSLPQHLLPPSSALSHRCSFVRKRLPAANHSLVRLPCQPRCWG